MDGWLGMGMGLGDTMAMLIQKLSHPGGFMESDTDSPRGCIFSRSLASRESASNVSPITIDTYALSLADSACDSRVPCPSSAPVSSEPSGNDTRGFIRGTPNSCSPRSHSIRSLFSSSGKRKTRNPVLVEKMPFGKRSEYLTLYVGSHDGQREKFVISRRLLAHPLLQVLMKCSEDEFGEDYMVKSGIAIICDPSLFLEVVRAVDEDMQSSQNAQTIDVDV